MDWQMVKEHLQNWYGKVAKFIIFQNGCLYVIASISSGHPIGPAVYAAFLYRIFTFAG